MAERPDRSPTATPLPLTPPTRSPHWPRPTRSLREPRPSSQAAAGVSRASTSTLPRLSSPPKESTSGSLGQVPQAPPLPQRWLPTSGHLRPFRRFRAGFDTCSSGGSRRSVRVSPHPHRPPAAGSSSPISPRLGATRTEACGAVSPRTPVSASPLPCEGRRRRLGMPRPGSAPRWAAASGRWGCRLLVLLPLLVLGPGGASEITFELPDNAKQCFYEDITQGTKCTLEFQVLRARPRAPALGPGVGSSRQVLASCPGCFTPRLMQKSALGS